jgi:AcrR family transcriptional regulator
LSPRPDVSEERKKQILEAAISVFAKLGFHKARMDDIVEASGLSKGALYWYFKSKEDLIKNIMDSIFASSMKEFQYFPDVQDSAREQIANMLIHSMHEAKQMLEIRPIVYEIFAYALRDRIIQKTIREYFNTYTEQLTPIIQEGINKGEFRDIDPFSAALALGAIFEGTILLWMIAPDTVDINLHFRDGLNLLLDGFERE